MPGLSGTHKTNLTTVATAIDAAINSITTRQDSTQAGVLAVLQNMRGLLSTIQTERNQ